MGRHAQPYDIKEIYEEMTRPAATPLAHGRAPVSCASRG